MAVNETIKLGIVNQPLYLQRLLEQVWYCES